MGTPWHRSDKITISSGKSFARNTLLDMEEVSDSDDAGKSSDDSEDASEIDSDEDLRLTSTDEEKESKKGKKDKRKPRDDPERVRARKQRELRREILRWVIFISFIHLKTFVYSSGLKELQQEKSWQRGEVP